jgi:uroporphyrinogen-III synthase
MRTVLLTRPLVQSQKTALRLASLGIMSHIDPLLTIEQLPISINLKNSYQAILLTSAYAVSALQQMRQSPLILTVGDATAEVVRNASLARQVISANGTSRDLVLLIERNLKPHDGSLLYISGREVRYDITHYLKERGFLVDRVIAYRTHLATHLLPKTYELLRRGQLQSILFYSRRTAQTFANIVKQDQAEYLLKDTQALTLSKDVGKPLLNLPFKQIKVANSPTEAALIMKLGGSLWKSKK